MKRVLLSVLAFFLALPCFSQTEVGKYFSSYFNKEYSILSSLSNSGAIESVYIGITGEYSSEDVNISVKGSDLDEFIKSLEQIKEKYAEWEKVAKENNVTDMAKDFDIKMPKVTICWYSSKWYFNFNKQLRPRFLITESGKICFVCTGEATASSNEYITTDFYFALGSTEDFDNLIKAISPTTIKEFFSSKQNKEDLFK